MRVLMIGAKGFVGAALTRLLLSRNHQVTVLELRDSPGRLADVRGQLDWVVGDGSSQEAILSAIGRHGVDAIFYGPYYRAPAGEPAFDRELDVMAVGAWRVFQLARALDVRVVFPSSFAVHGAQPEDGSQVSETARMSPFGLYGAYKLLCERVATEINAAIGTNRVTCVRLAAVYGPGAEIASRGVNIPAVRAARGERAQVPYREDVRVGIVHVDDSAAHLAAAIEAPQLAHTVYESGGLDVSFADIAAVVRGLVPGAEIEFGEDTRQVLPNDIDWSRIRDELGAEHRDLRAGMASVVEYERGRSHSSLI